MADSTIRCDAPLWSEKVGAVNVSVSLNCELRPRTDVAEYRAADNGCDFTMASLSFVFYLRPKFNAPLPFFPTGAPKAGNTIVTLLGKNFDPKILDDRSDGIGLNRSSSVLLIWCRFRADAQQVAVPATDLLTLRTKDGSTTEAIVCTTPSFLALDPRAQVKAAVALSLNNLTFHELADDSPVDGFIFFAPPRLSAVSPLSPLGGPTRLFNTITLSGTSFNVMLKSKCDKDDTQSYIAPSMYDFFLGNVQQKTESNEACDQYALRCTVSDCAATVTACFRCFGSRNAEFRLRLVVSSGAAVRPPQ